MKLTVFPFLRKQTIPYWPIFFLTLHKIACLLLLFRHESSLQSLPNLQKIKLWYELHLPFLQSTLSPFARFAGFFCTHYDWKGVFQCYTCQWWGSAIWYTQSHPHFSSLNLWNNCCQSVHQAISSTVSWFILQILSVFICFRL